MIVNNISYMNTFTFADTVKERRVSTEDELKRQYDNYELLLADSNNIDGKSVVCVSLIYFLFYRQ
jgi:hypothetical protein